MINFPNTNHLPTLALKNLPSTAQQQPLDSSIFQQTSEAPTSPETNNGSATMSYLLNLLQNLFNSSPEIQTTPNLFAQESAAPANQEKAHEYKGQGVGSENRTQAQEHKRNRNNVA